LRSRLTIRRFFVCDVARGQCTAPIARRSRQIASPAGEAEGGWLDRILGLSCKGRNCCGADLALGPPSSLWPVFQHVWRWRKRVGVRWFPAAAVQVRSDLGGMSRLIEEFQPVEPAKCVAGNQPSVGQ
jgi:hypothetical protein